MSTIAYFVSPHGLGHAARAAAVMAALVRQRSEIRLHVFTTAPRWFFEDSLEGPFEYHAVRVDVGLEQRHPLSEDLPGTVERLRDFWGALPTMAGELGTVLGRLDVDLVVSDVSPLGLAAAERAGIRSVLVENFTWDWIYEAYQGEEPRLEEFARLTAETNRTADLHVQTEPVCRPAADAVTVSPVGRSPRAGAAEVRRLLGLDAGDGRPLVLLTMGGMGWRSSVAGAAGDELFFVTLGGTDVAHRQPGRLALPDRSPIYPPDLVLAADLVVAKLGYSTLAECHRAGARLLFLDRPRFRESAVLARYARRELAAEALEVTALESGRWLEKVAGSLARPRPEPSSVTGAEEVARLLLEKVDSGQ